MLTSSGNFKGLFTSYITRKLRKAGLKTANPENSVMAPVEQKTIMEMVELISKQQHAPSCAMAGFYIAVVSGVLLNRCR